MKQKNKLAILLTTFLMILSVILPSTSVFAIPAAPSTPYTGPGPDTTTVNITKLVSKGFPKGSVPADGSEQKLGSLEAALGLSSGELKTLEGVTFSYVKLDKEDANKSISELQDEGKIASYEGKATVFGTTDGQGVASKTIEKKDYGTYYFFESAKPANISSGLAVPFLLTLPLANDKGFMDEVYLYPKNVETEDVTPDKDVEEEGNKHSTANIGENVKWFLKGTIPSNIQDLKVYTFKDTFSQGLTLNQNTPVESVKYGAETLERETHYTINVEGQTLTVALTEKGIEEIAENVKLENRNKPVTSPNTQDNPIIVVEVNTFINTNAIMGQAIPNNVTIEYGHDPNNTTETNEIPDKPEVHTGGKKFEKVDAVNNATKLSGAKFELYATDEQTPITWTQELITANPEQAQNVQVGDTVVLTSGEDGSFEIKGLSYGKKGNAADAEGAQTEYKLKEIEAPVGYVVSNEFISFVVNQTSYNTTPTGIASNQGDAEPQEVQNAKKPEIPQTGGIGSAIFIAIGLGLMAVAYMKLRNTKEA